ncbi:MAG: hypothetical protein OES34_11060 [Nitrosopumilus sp.]|nr:hypothetical protein [Nitrosopumilus sp.]
MSRYNIKAAYELTPRGNTRDDFYQLLRNIAPTSEVTDGATLTVANDQLACDLSVPRWQKFEVLATDFTAGGTTEDVALFTLPAGGVIHAVRLKHSVAFAGGSIAGYTLSVGVAGDLDKFAVAFDVFQPVAGTTDSLQELVSGETHAVGGIVVRVAAVSSGADLVAGNIGTCNIWVLYSVTD